MKRSPSTPLLAVALILTLSCTDHPSPHSPEGGGAVASGVDSPSLPPPDEPPAENDPVVLDPSAGQRLRVTLGGCRRAGCELLFDFSLPMVAADRLAEAEPPPITFRPTQEGTFAWRSATRLSFVPAEGFLGWGQGVEITMAAATPLAGEDFALERKWLHAFRVPYFRAAGKVASWPVVPGEPRFVAVLNWHTGQIGRGPLFLLYDQPVEISDVELSLGVNDAAGRPLAWLVERPADAGQVTADETLDLSHLVALSVHDLPPDGERIRVSMPRRPKAEAPEILRQDLTVDTSFHLLGFHLLGYHLGGPQGDGRAPLTTVCDLAFSDPFEITRLEEALTVSPRPVAVQVAAAYPNLARVRLELEPGRRYHLTLEPGFKDALGNALEPAEESFDIRLHSHDQAPALELPRLPVLLERHHARLAMRVRNVTAPFLEVRRFATPRAFVRALGSERRSQCMAYGLDGESEELHAGGSEHDDVGELNVTTTLAPPLDLEPGLLCVEAHAEGRGSRAAGALVDAVLAQSSDLGLTTKVFGRSALVWVTRLSDAGPVAGARVRLLDAAGTTLGEAVSDEHGVATIATVTGSGALPETFFVAAEVDGEGSVADVAVARLDQERLSQAWQFGLAGEVDGARPLDAALFTERGVYRPGEVVHIKAIVRPDSPADSPADPPADSPAPRQITLTVHDPRGQQVTSRLLELDDFGGADLDLPLKQQAPVGEYSLRAMLGRRTVWRGFRVEEYRVPSFRVTVESPAKWQRGDDATALVSAAYLHGGDLGGRAVRWKVARDSQLFKPAAFPRWVFQSAEVKAPAGTLAHGEQRLDEGGRLVVGFTADHPSSSGPMRYTVEATVSDVDRQAYAGRLSRVVHPAAFYVGIKPPSRQVLAASETLEVPVVAVTPDGVVLPGVAVRLQLERVDHHTAARLAAGHSSLASLRGAPGDARGGGSRRATVQHLDRPVTVAVEQCLLTTSETAVSCSFEVPRSGAYRVRAWARDRDHQTVQTGFRFTASGDQPAAWPRFDPDRIEVVADRPSYAPGEVAKLVVETPFERARGLLTIERGRVLEHRLFTIDRDTPAIEVPITAEHAPNVYASVVLLRGREHDQIDATGFETGAPSFKIGYVQLTVEPIEQRLAVAVESAAGAAPGDTLRVKLAVHDHRGVPQPGSATLMVVDEAVLGMTGYRTPDPVSELYAPRPLGVRTGEGRLELPHARRSRLEKLFPGGDGGKQVPLAELGLELRKLFESTAYWNPAVEVGADGTAVVDVELPDNTTTYRLMAVLAGTGGRAGAGENWVVVKKPLLVRPVLPRFVYPGDRLRIEALAFNGTPEGGEVEVAADLGGLRPVGPEPGFLRVGAGETASFPFQVEVTGRDLVRVRFAARLVSAGREHTDAVEVELPVLSPGTRRSLVASRTISAGGAVTVDLPAERLPGTVQAEVVASTTALTELEDAVRYLMRYPNGCIEQTVSTAYPLVVLGDLLPEIGVTVDPAKLEEYSKAGIRRILSFQTEDGGLSYWPGGTEPHAFATAFGLTALIEGKKRGHEVPEEALEGMADYLEATLRQGRISGEMPHGGIADGDTRAFFVMTLGRLGRPQPGYLAALWQKRRELTPFGLSFLAIAASETGETALVAPILEEVRRGAREEPREAWFEGRPKGGWSFDSPLRTHAGALLAFATGGSDWMGGKLLNGLLERRRHGLWGNTQENVFGIMGVHAIAGGETDGQRPLMELSVEGRLIPEETLEKVSRRVRRLTLTEDDLGLVPGRGRTLEAVLAHRGGPPIVLTLRARFEVPLSEANRRPRNDGFEVIRSYESPRRGANGTSPNGEITAGDAIPLGSLVRVRLTVRTGERHNYVALADKLPAGLEPLNANLETTERVSLGPMTPNLERGLGLLSYQEIRDSRVAFFFDQLPAGTFEVVYMARATTPGTFLRPAAEAEAMYLPEVSGATSIDEVTVR